MDDKRGRSGDLRAIWWAAVALLGIVPALAAQQAAGESLLQYGTELKLPAGVLPEERTLWIHLPPGYAAGSDRYDVLYVLDAHGLFPLASSMSDYLALMGRMPATMVVGITSLSPADRARNFTPVMDSSRRDRFPQAGHADRFLEFLEKEAIPAIDRRYRTTSTRRLAGHSLAGLFALHVLATRPRLFEGYIAISPSLGWADGYTLRALERLFAGSPDPRFLFASVANEPGVYTESLARLETIMQRAPRGWRWKTARFLNEDHGTTVAPALHSALRAVYDSSYTP